MPDITALAAQLARIECPNATEYLALKLKRASCLDISVRAEDAAGTRYQACADDCDGEGHWFGIATAYGVSAIAALDNLASKLGFVADEDGNLRRAVVQAQVAA